MTQILSVSGDEVLAALMTDSEYAGQPPAVLAAMEPFVRELPNLLADDMEKPVNLTVLMGAALKYHRYCAENGLLHEVAKFLPEELADGLGAQKLEEMLKGANESFRRFLENLVADVQKFLDSRRISEEIMMAHPQGIGLNHALLEKYHAGSLTLADVLREQPIVIVKTRQV